MNTAPSTAAHAETRAAVLLMNPKYPRNIGAAVRTCAAYGVRDLLYTGDRLDKAMTSLSRLPREERVRGYRSVSWRASRRPFEEFPELTPVAIEVREASEALPDFEHPEHALYVFGPEDGSLDGAALSRCHRFVAIPTRHCLNLAVAVATVLYDRQAKLAPELRMTMARAPWRPVSADPDEVG